MNHYYRRVLGHDKRDCKHVRSSILCSLYNLLFKLYESWLRIEFFTSSYVYWMVGQKLETEILKDLENLFLLEQ